MNRNYQKELDRIIQGLNYKPALLLHSCCAPCSSYCLEYLSQHFNITVFYYNPNITDEAEYRMRAAEQERLINAFNEKSGWNIGFVEGDYDPQNFFEATKGYEDCVEGGDRCRICFALRLNKAAKYAADNKFDYYTTTLTISPLKNAEVLNDLGEAIAKDNEILFLPSDFKKKNGYKRSVELSQEYDLYRQNYCGCQFSKRDALARDNKER